MKEPFRLVPAELGFQVLLQRPLSPFSVFIESFLRFFGQMKPPLGEMAFAIARAIVRSPAVGARHDDLGHRRMECGQCQQRRLAIPAGAANRLDDPKVIEGGQDELDDFAHNDPLQLRIDLVSGIAASADDFVQFKLQ